MNSMNSTNSTSEAEGMVEAPESPRTAQFWLTQLTYARKDFDEWQNKNKAIINRYVNRSDTAKGAADRYNVFWSNIEILKPMTYSRLPKSAVERRFRTKDPVAKLSCEVLERANDFMLDTTGFDSVIRNVRNDFLLFARGIAWARYVPEFGKVVIQQPDELGGVVPVEVDAVVSQTVEWDFVHREDFRHGRGRVWEEVSWVARRSYLSRKEAEARFGQEVSEKLKYEYTPNPDDSDRNKSASDELDKKAVVWEIWDKATKHVYFVSEESETHLVEFKPDPLQLTNFFPCPKPMFGTLTTDSLIPTPDLVQYDNLCSDLDLIQLKISVLTDALRVAGIYDAEADGIEKLLTVGKQFKLIPVKNWPQVTATGGMKGVIEYFPMDQIANTLLALFDAKDKAVQGIYEITGMSDIVRGNTDANETATAQQIKGNFATVRLSEKQQEIQRFARDCVRIQSEIIAEQFEPQVLAQMVGEDIAQDPVFPYALELLKNDTLRNYRIDIETDSTIAVDENIDKNARNEFISAFGQFANQMLQVSQASPDALPLMGNMLLFGLRGFRAGRSMETEIEQWIEKLQEQAAQPQQEQPDPAVMQAQQQMQLDQQKAAADIQLGQQKIAMEWEAEKLRATTELQKHRDQMMLEVEKARQELATAAAQVQNTPQNKATTDTIAQIEPSVMPQQPMNLTINMPSQSARKRVVLTTDPITGAKVGQVEDVPPEPEVILG